jgi:hypothetical protein
MGDVKKGGGGLFQRLEEMEQKDEFEILRIND